VISNSTEEDQRRSLCGKWNFAWAACVQWPATRAISAVAEPLFPRINVNFTAPIHVLSSDRNGDITFGRLAISRNNYFAPWRGAEYCDEYSICQFVCLYVCLLALKAQSCMHVAYGLARSFSGGVAICHVLPVCG